MDPVEFAPNYLITADGKVLSTTTWSKKEQREMTLRPDKDGYLFARVIINGEETRVRVHRLVAFHFIRPPQDGEQVRHLNGINIDNRMENLAWGTAKDNADDRGRHGRTAVGERNGNSKLTADKVRAIRARLEERATQKRVAAEFGVHLSVIEKIVSGKRWSHVEGGSR